MLDFYIIKCEHAIDLQLNTMRNNSQSLDRDVEIDKEVFLNAVDKIKELMSGKEERVSIDGNMWFICQNIIIEILNRYGLIIEEETHPHQWVVVKKDIGITKEHFEKYLKVQSSGKYNMHDLTALEVSGLSEEMYDNIINNYDRLMREYEDLYKKYMG